MTAIIALIDSYAWDAPSSRTQGVATTPSTVPTEGVETESRVAVTALDTEEEASPKRRRVSRAWQEGVDRKAAQAVPEQLTPPRLGADGPIAAPSVTGDEVSRKHCAEGHRFPGVMPVAQSGSLEAEVATEESAEPVDTSESSTVSADPAGPEPRAVPAPGKRPAPALEQSGPVPAEQSYWARQRKAPSAGTEDRSTVG